MRTVVFKLFSSSKTTISFSSFNIVLGTEREQHAFEEEGMIGLQKAGVLNKGIDSVKNLFKKKDK